MPTGYYGHIMTDVFLMYCQLRERYYRLGWEMIPYSRWLEMTTLHRAVYLRICM